MSRKVVAIIGPKNYTPAQLEFGRRLIRNAHKCKWDFLLTDEPDSYDSAFISACKIASVSVTALCCDANPRSAQSQGISDNIGNVPKSITDSMRLNLLRRAACDNADTIVVVVGRGLLLNENKPLMVIHSYAKSLGKTVKLIQI